MALSCFLRKISPPVFRGSVIPNLNKRLIVSSCCAPPFRQTHYQQLWSGENRGKKELIAAPNSCWKSTSLQIDSKRFSTSSVALAQHKGHDHSKLWTFEKLLSVALLPLVPAAVVYPSQSLDTALALIVVLHTHFGFEAIVVDYVRPILFGQVVPKISLACVYLLSILTFAGLLNLIYNDAGLANTIIQIWKK